jgi:DNA-directed RNA polymerase subunit M/transcription elongation factor TFIIS
LREVCREYGQKQREAGVFRGQIVVSHKPPNVGIEPPKVGSNDGLGVCPIDATTVGVPMHTAPMTDSQGEFAEFKVQPEIACRKCGTHAVSMREWESSCGGWEDHQYKCHHCGHTWWVEGIDA